PLLLRQLLDGAEAFRQRVLLGRTVVAGPGGLEQCQAEQPLAVRGGERERRRTAAGVADEVEAIEAACVRFTQDAVDLGCERVVRRRLVRRVDRELLGGRVDAPTQHLEQRTIRRSRRQHAARQQYDRKPARLDG